MKKEQRRPRIPVVLPFSCAPFSHASVRGIEGAKKSATRIPELASLARTRRTMRKTRAMRMTRATPVRPRRFTFAAAASTGDMTFAVEKS